MTQEKILLTWSKGEDQNTTRHFLHLPNGYFVVSRKASRTGYSRKGKISGADWEVFFMDRYGQARKRVGLITGLKRAKAYAERLASDPTLV